MQYHVQAAANYNPDDDNNALLVSIQASGCAALEIVCLTRC